MSKTVLLIDKSIELKDCLQDHLFKVIQACSVEDAINILNNTNVDCVVSEINLPDATGVTLANFVKDTNASMPVILYSDMETEPFQESVSSGVIFLKKSPDCKELIDTIKSAIPVKFRRKVSMPNFLSAVKQLL